MQRDGVTPPCVARTREEGPALRERAAGCGSFHSPWHSGKLPSAAMAEPATRYCPDCATKMREYRVGSVEVDRCPKCLGMWFDWGELEQATGRSLEPELFDGH